MKLNNSEKQNYLFFLSIIAVVYTAVLAVFSYPEFKELLFFNFYMILSNCFAGMIFPHEPLMIYFGKSYQFFIPVIIAIVPTVIGCAVDYLVLIPLFNTKVLRKMQNSGIHNRAAYYFSKKPFKTVMIFALLPLPFYPVRILSVTTKFPFKKYSASVVLGRVPRYLFLAYSGKTLNIPDYAIVLLFIFIAILPLLMRFLPGLERKSMAIPIDEQSPFKTNVSFPYRSK